MVVNMIKWRPWPPLQSKKFEAKIVVRCLNGLRIIESDKKNKSLNFGRSGKLTVEIKWKGSRTNGFRSLRKKWVKKNTTREQGLTQNGVVEWDEEFKSVCEFYGSKDKVDGVYHPWEVAFLVFNGLKKPSKKRVPLVAPSVLNLAEFATLDDVKEIEINIPLSTLSSGLECSPLLCISLSLMERRTTQELPEKVQRPVLFSPLSPCFGASLTITKDDCSFKPSLRRVKSLTDYVSSRNSKKAYRREVSSDSKFSTGSEDSESIYPFDTDSFDDTDEVEFEESKEDADVQKSCGYGTLVHANARRAIDLRINSEDDDLVYYSNKKPEVDCSTSDDLSVKTSQQVLTQSPKFRFLVWRKRKLSFRSSRVRGEPLLKKYYGEEGGDDIDFDRRQLSSDDNMVVEELAGSGSLISEFGDDNFSVGSWEIKEVLSRDGSMKLRTQVFFASIDQRSERAAGESACTALVAVIADWLHSNLGEMPIKSELDSLIREGSLQWRNLCDNDTYMERFPDKHFDLETVLQAEICPLSVVPKRSFIGFFHPEGLDEECFDFLHGAMSFDNIWDEISRAAANSNDYNSKPLVYIVSWNDHFFILRVDSDAYYIIDTLGERLYEGCNQAYVLKFDWNTIIERMPPQATPENEKSTEDAAQSLKEKLENSEPQEEKAKSASPGEGEEAVVNLERLEDETVVCRGKESCKEYIKNFLAAIPIRELQVDMKKGLMASTPLHHRLQIEFNYTVQVPPTSAELVAVETAADVSSTMVALDVAYGEV